MSNLTMRDAFWNRLYEFAKADRNVVLVVSDMGAPALDRFKTDLPAQVIQVGVAEQNALLLATGLALAGKKPYVYSISSFLTSRCYEQIRLYASGMHLPITLVGVGAGVCYAESGPTHHAIDDVTILRGLPGMRILNVSDNRMAESAAAWSYEYKGPCYVRLDRIIQPTIHSGKLSFEEGLLVLRPLSKVNILASGSMMSIALDVSDKLKEQGLETGVIEAYILPLHENAFLKNFSFTDTLVTLEEHSLSGGIGSNACELVMDLNLPVRVRRFGFDVAEKGYSYVYGGRELIHREYGMSKEEILSELIRLHNEKIC